ncbi:hypothetical protein ISM_10780 [Roseovarius nubinhibens ISM]|uniref:Uncharacterized protein n=1 Tax=Roseovarius nubinhibens (strain ATCC BAA-591 / DSM 15170 / ISM) TaxID=89187 RepID=A3SR43_ROSNI|nr:hypothetical protein ISM_10780 [Roseovarius nubinhibens ISM]
MMGLLTGYGGGTQQGPAPDFGATMALTRGKV